MGKNAAAEQIYKKALTLHPNYWPLYSWLGYFYYGEAHYQEAAEMFRKVNELAPDNHRGYSDLGAMYLYQGDYDKSIAASNRSIELRPTMDAYVDLGAAYFLQHRFDDAISAFQEGIKLGQDDPVNWGNLGDALYWTPAQRPEAAAAYRRALAIAKSQLDTNPENGSLWAYVAQYSAMIGDKADATSAMRKALELAPNDPEVMFRAALVSNHFGNKKDCFSWIKKAVAAGYPIVIVKDTPDFANLKNDPDFQAATTR